MEPTTDGIRNHSVPKVGDGVPASNPASSPGLRIEDGSQIDDWAAEDDGLRKDLSSHLPFNNDFELPRKASILSSLKVLHEASAKAAPEFNMIDNSTSKTAVTPVPQTTFDILAARHADFHMLHSVQFELVHGDTIVFIDLPHNPRVASRLVDCDGIPFRSQMFRVHSEKLLATGSSKFADMLNPTYQYRVQRRRKLANNLPEGIKFVLDLTPPSEGDEIVFQMTELSLTPGIVNWWSSKKIHGTAAETVLGHDDICSCKKDESDLDTDDYDGRTSTVGKSTQIAAEVVATPQNDRVRELKMSGLSRKVIVEILLQEESEKANNAEMENKDDKADGKREVLDDNLNEIFKPSMPPTPQDLLRIKELGDRDSPPLYHTPSFRHIPDYCRVRHCNGIIRLLLLIEGRHVLLNSANRVWTLVALTKIFDCAPVLRDPVVQWLFSNKNSRFIEVLPEEALHIGFALKIPQVTQAAFRILVNELAIRQADDAHDGSQRQVRTTIFGRKLGDCGDELSNIIQHAARAFVERINSVIAQFQDNNFLDYLGTSMWQRLRETERLVVENNICADASVQADALKAIRRLTNAMTYAMQLRFLRSTRTDIDASEASFSSMDSDRALYASPDSFDLLDVIFRRMNMTQRFLCPFIYHKLTMDFDTILFSNRSSEEADSAGVPFQSLLDDAELAMLKFVKQNISGSGGKAFENELREAGIFFYPGFDSVEMAILRPLEHQIAAALRPITNSWIRHDLEPPLNITRHMLLTLSNNEMKYLPLWAGGCDDGTGSVFESYVPLSDMGPNGPGPAFHTGVTIPSSASGFSGSVIDGISEMQIRGSTVVGSVDAQDSVSTVYNPKHVIADGVSIASESFASDGADYQDARFAESANHQITSVAVNAVVESAPDQSTASYGDGSLDDSDYMSDRSSTIGEESDSDDAVMVDMVQ